MTQAEAKKIIAGCAGDERKLTRALLAAWKEGRSSAGRHAAAQRKTIGGFRSLTGDQRKEAARRGARARWGKKG